MCAAKVTGGVKLDAALAKLLEGSTLTMRAGILEGARYPDGKPVALVGFWNEYGTSREVGDRVVSTPPRPFMRSTAASKGNRWAKVLGVTMQRNGGDIEAAMRLAGEAAMSDIKQTIGTFTDPPNAESTVARKGHNQPLRDTKQMLNSIAYDLVDGPAE